MQRNHQRKCAACAVEDQQVINVETYAFVASPVKRRAWIVTGNYTLTQKEREILMSPAGWLSDPIINAAQLHLKEESGLLGFQETTLGMTLAYDVLWGGFIQIVHDGFGHWLTISTIEATSSTEVFIYDSMYASISTNVKRQIETIMAQPEEKITVKMMDVQKQVGGSNCGLFAIAFATALINGKQPGSIVHANSFKCVLAVYACMGI